ncbi:hypothetical protein BH09BAC4_BH09BAC4_05280 [soil metagenome]
MERQVKEIVKIIGFILILTVGKVFAQTSVFFEYKNPRNGNFITASSYYNDFAVRRKPLNLRCYYGMGWYRFHIKQTGVIDSVAFTGDIHPELKSLGEKYIRDSQVYWQCINCTESGGQWVTIPVMADLFTGEIGCQVNTIYKQSVAFWNNLFINQKNEQISIGKNEWLLAPMYAIAMH